MPHSLRWIVAALAAAAVSLAAATEVEKAPKIEALIAMHDLKTSISIGHYYLKQETLLAVRGQLARIGREEGLGPEWNPANPYWRQAEEAMLEQVMAQVGREFASLQWLRPLWIDLGAAEFSDRELDALIAHFHSEVGRKQIQIVDHTVSTHVMMALSFSGKLKDVPGVDEERDRMQRLWNDEDDAMRFSIQDAANAEGQRFALSPLGKKYFVTAVLKLTGIVSRRLDDLAAQLPASVATGVERVRPLVDEFKSARS
jgi:hypothetical protein